MFGIQSAAFFSSDKEMKADSRGNFIAKVAYLVQSSQTDHVHLDTQRRTLQFLTSKKRSLHRRSSHKY